ncbi:hypothetical protein OHA72_14040 [Dactylosporangium sp. NBC_01737]|uniref:hypothetical protein n=1 Tax=Dactylosporangium sp. NBC_01737 TaxID=2975959 RepID=UPI002E0DE67F|nr:hypothetical protein OHA72_14040 [Dactylosporangium sp. NBC_01737]
MRQIRAISSWATAAMLTVAAAALTHLCVAFLPLLDIWAAHRPGSDVGAVRLGAWAVLATTVVTAWVVFTGWARRARSNLVAFGIRTTSAMPLLDVAVGSVGRAPALRRSMTVLTWLWWIGLLAALAAAALGVVAGLENLREIDDVRDRVAAGGAVDRALVSHLFGRQLLLRLPGAALGVVAAAFALVLIARVTSAQYGRVARIRGAAVTRATLGALRAGDEDWTVVLPLPVGGTIRQ